MHALDKLREWLEKRHREMELHQLWIDQGCNVEWDGSGKGKPVFTE